MYAAAIVSSSTGRPRVIGLRFSSIGAVAQPANKAKLATYVEMDFIFEENLFAYINLS